ncbi:MAG: bifunctional phosphopantothenoylcysteine decarboxylase/phosphopantothenate--cysteine ligase CoaBC [Fibrobacterota bacterium]
MDLSGKKILVGITGGIAAYKIPGLVRALIREGAEVQAILTKNAGEFVGRAALSTLTQRKVLEGLFDQPEALSTAHIAAAEWADALLVAPATANGLAKFASGIADDFLSTTYLSVKCPVIVAPSMNETMWSHPATQANLALLKKRGVRVIEPGTGDLACGTQGKGRLPSEAVLVFSVRCALSRQDLQGQRLLITCGGTQEAFDPVRVLTNRSSGKTGIAIAVAALERGASVTLVHGHVTEPIPEYVHTVRADSAADMHKVVTGLFRDSDALIMAAAVADFTPAQTSKEKIKKDKGVPALELKATADILKAVARNKGRRKIVGFALETGAHAEKSALAKLKEKKCDLLVLNGPAALGSERNRITLIHKSGDFQRLDEMDKRRSADVLLDALVRL